MDAGRIAAIGYCMGGGVSLNMARAGTELRGVASFHGSLNAILPAKAGRIKAKLLVQHGADDKFIPPAAVEAFKKEMAEAGADLKFIPYPGALRSFTNPDADAYAKQFGMPIAHHAEADAKSWAVLQAFLKDVFKWRRAGLGTVLDFAGRGPILKGTYGRGQGSAGLALDGRWASHDAVRAQGLCPVFETGGRMAGSPALERKSLFKRILWHVLLTHFPISFFMISAGFMVLHLFTDSVCFEKTAFLCLAAGTLVLFPAAFSGLLTWREKYQRARTHIFVTKLRAAYVILPLGVFLVLWRVLFKTTIHTIWHYLYAAGIMVLFAGVVLEGAYGGRLNHGRRKPQLPSSPA